MRNAKSELIQNLLDTNTQIKCALIYYGKSQIVLKVGHLDEEYESFMKSLDFTYDSGYGEQELYGTVWLQDGTWLERGEYDGSEWWEHKKLPPIPDKCLIDYQPININKFEDLKGQTITKIDFLKNEYDVYISGVIFHVNDKKYLLTHIDECCESVTLEDVVGDWDDIINTPVLLAEERTNGPENGDTEQWTFYTIRTIKGSIDMRWYGESNGYYSMGVDFFETK